MLIVILFELTHDVHLGTVAGEGSPDVEDGGTHHTTRHGHTEDRKSSDNYIAPFVALYRLVQATQSETST